MRNTFRAIHHANDHASELLPSDSIIRAWKKETISAWMRALKVHPTKTNDPNFLPELMAVISRAVELTSGYKPHDIQIISVLILLDAKTHGRLAEIATGEGKSIIIMMFSAIKVLQGETVDIITSSSLLAKRDALRSKKFFELFDITVSHNCDKQDKGFKACYAANVVYGDISHFQFDALRHDYKCENTRATRGYGVVVADEVDSMLVDESMKIASLGCYKPSMENLEPLLIATWIELLRVQCSRSDHTKESLTQHLADYIEALLFRDDSPILIPYHLKYFAKKQAPYWANSAVTAACHFIRKTHYLLTKNENNEEVIAPVDYLNTGVLQTNSAWDDGLHQFLQIKHGVRLTAENLTASFISNVSYFKRYQNKIFGLTGTLGSQDTKKLLQKIYSVDVVEDVPTFKNKIFKEKTGILAENKAEWVSALTHHTKIDVETGRAVLIICESINAVEDIIKALEAAGISNLTPYARDDFNTEDDIFSQKLKPSDVVVATNLAGRGTDPQTTDEVENNGGTSVYVTFLPHNERVEKQAFGRTARQGKKGTAQLIINKEDVLPRLQNHYPNLGTADTIKNLKAWRNAADNIELGIAEHFELDRVLFKDELFSHFCAFTQKLRALELNHFKLDDIEERWGFWLKELERKFAAAETINQIEIRASLENFEQQLWSEYTQSNLQNPCQWIKLGNHYTSNAEYEKAIDAYTRAIVIDPHFAAQAYYNRVGARILSKGGDYKSAAVHDLQSARSCLHDHTIPQLQTSLVQLMLMLSSESAAQSPLIKQLNTKIELFQKQIQHIDAAITRISGYAGDIEMDQPMTLSAISADSDDITRELYNSGLTHFFSVKEVIAPEDDDDDGLFSWIRRIGVVILGVCQIVVGVCLMVTGNAYLGQAVIEMGVSDIMFAVRSALEDTKCSWSEYRSHKIVSSAIILATIGIDVIRTSATQATQTGVKEGMKTTINKEAALSLAKEKVVTAITNAGIRETLNYGVSRLEKCVIAEHKSDIKEKVRATILKYFNHPDFQVRIDRILSADARHATQLHQYASDIIHPKQDALFSMGSAIFKGVLANQDPLLRIAITTADVASHINKIIHFCKEFCAEFSEKIVLLENQLLTTIVTQDQSSARNALYENIIHMITRCIMNDIHSSVMHPIVNTVMSEHFDSVAQYTQGKILGSIQSVMPTEAELKACQQYSAPVVYIETMSQTMTYSKPASSQKKNTTVKVIINGEEKEIPVFKNTMSTPSYPLELITVAQLIRYSKSKTLNTTLIFAVNTKNEFILSTRWGEAPRFGGLYEQQHSRLVDGGSVLTAGEIRIECGKITVTNKSGHYKPQGLHQEALIRQHLSSIGITDFEFEYVQNSAQPVISKSVVESKQADEQLKKQYSESKLPETLSSLGVFLDKGSHIHVIPLYRGDHRAPSEIHSEGFNSHGKNMDIMSHAVRNPSQLPDSGFVATSTSKEVAIRFSAYAAKKEKSGFVYEINPQRNSVDVSKVSGENYKHRTQKERAVPLQIKKEDIKGAWQVNIDPINKKVVLSEVYIPNQHYIAPLSTASKVVSSVGHGLTAISITVDGINLCSAYQRSQETDNFEYFFDESARVAGGWSGAIALGSVCGRAGSVGGAFIGGPIGSLAGGVVSGITCSIIGYHMGSSAAQNARKKTSLSTIKLYSPHAFFKTDFTHRQLIDSQQQEQINKSEKCSK